MRMHPFPSFLSHTDQWIIDADTPYGYFNCTNENQASTPVCWIYSCKAPPVARSVCTSTVLAAHTQVCLLIHRETDSRLVGLSSKEKRAKNNYLNQLTKGKRRSRARITGLMLAADILCFPVRNFLWTPSSYNWTEGHNRTSVHLGIWKTKECGTVRDRVSAFYLIRARTLHSQNLFHMRPL